MAYKRIGIIGTVLAALSTLASSKQADRLTVMKSRSMGCSSFIEAGTPLIRYRVRSRKTMTVPQLKRVAKKRRNMAKRGQR